jgi:hypothetical protein
MYYPTKNGGVAQTKNRSRSKSNAGSEDDRAHATNKTRRNREASTLLEPTGSAKVTKSRNELAEKRGG